MRDKSNLVGGLNHVVAVPAGDGDEGNSLGVVSDLLDVSRDLRLDLLEALLAVWRLSGVLGVVSVGYEEKVPSC